MPKTKSTASPRSSPPSAIARAAVRSHGAMQKVPELAELLEILYTNRVRTVLEIGGMHGGTTWAWRQCGATRVVVVDKFVLEGRMAKADASHILIEADSHNPAVVDRVRPWAPYDFLFIDGDHAYDGVRKDFEMYAPLVRPGGLVALHDVTVEQPAKVRPVHDVVPFWNQVRKHYTHEEIYSGNGEVWGGIGVLWTDDPATVAAVAAMPYPTPVEREATVPCDDPCTRCGKQLQWGEDTVCHACASG